MYQAQRIILGMRCRPLKVRVVDCRVCIDLAARNAVWAAVLRLIAAGKLPRKYGVRRDMDADESSGALPRRGSKMLGTPQGKGVQDVQERDFACM